MMWETILAMINWEYALRLLLACCCGALVGGERKRRHKDAGIRTHLLVTLGATLVTIVSCEGFGGDPSRVAANIVTGIGFLGAGVIFVKGRSVTGLTTAAGIWTMAGVGMAVGTGLYGLAIMATLLVVLLQYLMRRIPSSEQIHWQVTLRMRDASADALRSLMRRAANTEIQDFHIQREGEGYLVQLTCASDNAMGAEEALRLLQNNPEIIEIKG